VEAAPLAAERADEAAEVALLRRELSAATIEERASPVALARTELKLASWEERRAAAMNVSFGKLRLNTLY
jgi:hypothetical protein|tara:strand:- start:33287 stop:33496 length:210 start_codon:yes stop_codon:yes gene_type:complete